MRSWVILDFICCKIREIDKTFFIKKYLPHFYVYGQWSEVLSHEKSVGCYTPRYRSPKKTL